MHLATDLGYCVRGAKVPKATWGGESEDAMERNLGGVEPANELAHAAAERILLLDVRGVTERRDAQVVCEHVAHRGPEAQR